jgi:branched-chain amino acid transport system substrate-binding protein
MMIAIKRYLPVLLSVCYLASSAFAQAPEGTYIKIGVPAALSGDGAAYGNDVKNGILFANKKFGNGRYRLLFEDTKCSGRDAVSAAKKLVNIDKVDYVLGFACSGALLAAAPIFEKAKLVTIATATSAPAISQAGDYIFRTWPSDLASASVLLDYVEQKHKLLGVITEETEFCQGITKALTENNKSESLKLVHESFLPTTNDFRSNLSRLTAAGLDGLFLNTQSEVALLALYRQVLELKLGLPIYANYNASSPAFLRSFRERADGVVFFDVPDVDDLANSKGKALYHEFIKEFGEPQSSGRYVMTSIAGFAALDEAIRSGSDVKEYLYHSTFSQVINNLKFDANGDPLGLNQILKTIKHGRIAPLDSIK